MAKKPSARQQLYLDGLPSNGTERISGSGTPMTTVRALQRAGLVSVRYIAAGSRWAIARTLPRGTQDPRNRLLTPENFPDHGVVGRHFAGAAFDKPAPQMYFCDSYDPRQGYWMSNLADPEDRRNVSERAIGGTYMPAEDRGDHWWISRWSTRMPKAEAAPALATN